MNTQVFNEIQTLKEDSLKEIYTNTDTNTNNQLNGN